MEDSRAFKRFVFNFAEKISRYCNSWIFLKICLVFNTVPKGIKLKKSAQIGNKTDQFLTEWTRVLLDAEKELTHLLMNQYKSSIMELEIQFWNKIIEYVASEPDGKEVKDVMNKLYANCKRIDADLKKCRRKKLHKILPNIDFAEVEQNLERQISFSEDLEYMKNFQYQEAREERQVNLYRKNY